uniref:Origin recognition complex subunit 5 n=1 Tax=Crassostrea virginica TaxID=6565 RepID=A0A8B8B125_CRAVI|nr:origin recognition complex subunit 5-like [Crassostrea virginica]XP_022297026.1 origin recognition complex subunit 5-like [Crassostrea virginica]XP_022297027.1 origin recognition complex subunit 5-like [Crassostrea virginica]
MDASKEDIPYREEISSISESLPCRESQIKLLLSLFGEREFMTLPSFFLYGHTATGKSAVINSILKTCKLPHVLVNCVECYSSRFLYEAALNGLYACRESGRPDMPIKCENMNDFVRLFRQTCSELHLQNETVYIVLDKAERLREMDANILPAFLRMQELVDGNVCVILLSEIVWEKFRCGTGFLEPLIVHFPDYNKDELLRILVRSAAAEYSLDFYQMYLSLVLSVFHMVCRNLSELQHLAAINFKKYVEPIKSGEATENDSRKLWKNFEPHLKKALQTVYLREVSSTQWEKMLEESDVGKMITQQGLSSRTHVELPYYSKYLLIAAYLASYNPAKSDKKFFSKHSDKQKKKLLKKQERTNNHMLGPKPFPLDRLMAVFYAIVEGKVAPTANIFMQITSLVSVHLLAQVAGDDQIDVPKYKCLVSLDFIKSVARTVNFDVIRYLYDFV